MIGEAIKQLLIGEIEQSKSSPGTTEMLKGCVDMTCSTIEAMCPTVAVAGKEGVSGAYGPMIPDLATMLIVYGLKDTAVAIGFAEDEWKQNPVPDMPPQLLTNTARIWAMIAEQVEIGTKDALMQATTVLMGRIGRKGQEQLWERLAFWRAKQMTPVVIVLAGKFEQRISKKKAMISASGMMVTWGLPATIESQVASIEGKSH